jgi:hypothetical protein
MGTAASSETPGRNRAILAGMGGNDGENPKEAARKARDERLAAALRANLRRRKAAPRDLPESPADDAPDDGGSERK